jgi:tetratricopeptide (TPR) repeat protein
VTMSDLKKAHKYFTQAYEIRKTNSDDDQLLAETQHSLGVLSRKRGELDAAQEFLLAALDTRRKYDNVLEAGETLLEIGNVYRLQKDPESALSIYEKGLEVVDMESILAARIRFAFGHAVLSNGHHLDALHWYSRVREKYLAEFGRDDRRTGSTSRSLGLAHFLLSQADESLVHLNEFVRVCEHQEKDDASETVDYAMAVLLLGDIHSSKGKLEQATNVWTVAKEVCDDNGFESNYPEFYAIIGRRLERDGGAAVSGKKSSFFRRGSGEGDGLKTDPEDIQVLENLFFMDDY